MKKQENKEIKGNGRNDKIKKKWIKKTREIRNERKRNEWYNKVNNQWRNKKTKKWRKMEVMV